MIKRVLTLALAMSASLVAVPTMATEIILTSEVATSHWKTKYMEEFAAGVKERSQGEVTAKIFAGGQLYNDQDALAALGTGAVHMVWPVSVRLESVEPRSGILNLPFALTDEQMMDACFNSGLTKLVSSYIEPRNLQLLGFLRTSDLFFIFRDRNVQSKDDLKGSKIRVTGGRVFQETMKALDTSPVSMAASEMSTALAQGAIDGIFTSPAGWAEMIGMTGKYAWYVPGLSLSTYAIVVDKGWMDGLPEGHQKAIMDTVAEISERQWQEATDADDKLVKKMIDAGATFNVADDKQKADLQEIIRPSLKIFSDRNPEAITQFTQLETECGKSN